MNGLRAKLIVLVLTASLPLMAITVYVAYQLRAAQIENARSRLAAISMLAAAERRTAVEGGENAKQELLADANAAFVRSLVFFTIVFATALAAALLLGEYGIRRRAMALACASRRIAGGDLAARSGLPRSGDELAAVSGAFDHMAASLQKTSRILKVLSEANQAWVRARDETDLLQEICRIVVEHGGYHTCWVGYAENDAAKSVRDMAHHGLEPTMFAARRITWAEDERGRGPVGIAIRNRVPAIVRDTREDDADALWREVALERGYAAYAALPIESEGEVFGALAISASEKGRFDDAEVALLAELAANVGYGIRALRNRAALDRHTGRLEALASERTGALESANRFLDSVLENIPHMIFVKEATDLKFVRFNRAGEEMLGYARSELIGKNDYDFFPKAQADFLTALDREVIVSGSLMDIDEEPVHTRHRGTRFLHTKKIPVFDELGRPRYLVGISEDITDRKQKEREILTLNAALAQRATELEAVNRELEAFSYSVSHDLRAPLRHIEGYVEMLSSATRGQLPDNAMRFLQVISSAAVEMGELIDGLLAFSRTARTEVHRSAVDLDCLVREVVHGLEMAARDRRIEWRIALLPKVEGDAALLKQVYANLIGNAIKYTRPRDPAVIEVGAMHEEKGQLVFFVRDNGVGFDMQHTSKLFGVFQRLHRADEFEGTGIGLATVQRIVSRHGGRIWARATPDRGATFFFTLAPAESQDDESSRESER